MHAQLLGSTSEAELPMTARETLPVLLSETARIESLVNQWMFLARPEPPRTSRVDVAMIVAPVLAALRPAAEHAGVVFANRAATGLWVEGDARRLGQAVSNVVLNAIHAMTEGGTLIIESAREEGAVLLSFRDGGGGFSAEALARHAELFFSEKEGGMGMGLSVTHEILKAHGGELRAANAMPRGAIVTFRLPACA
jgi:signal transduction histidine kinase